LVLFNRSWYNRAGVEHVMGFCSNKQYESFLEEVVPFEHMLIRSGIQIVKYYLDIGKKEQKKAFVIGGAIRSSSGKRARSTKSR
jgi:polyphosphate kinase